MVKSMALEPRECQRKIDSVRLAGAAISKLARSCERTADRTGVGSDPAERKTRMPLGRAKLDIENHREVGARKHDSTSRKTQKRFLTPFCFPQAKLHFLLARLPNQLARLGTLRMCLLAPRRRITSDPIEANHMPIRPNFISGLFF